MILLFFLACVYRYAVQSKESNAGFSAKGDKKTGRRFHGSRFRSLFIEDLQDIFDGFTARLDFVVQRLDFLPFP